MGSNREVGGVVLAFGGFVFLVMAVRGTWGNVWHALVTGTGAAPDPTKWGGPGSGQPGVVAGSGNGKGQYVPIDPNAGAVDKNGHPIDPVTGRPSVPASYIFGAPVLVPVGNTVAGGASAQSVYL